MTHAPCGVTRWQCRRAVLFYFFFLGFLVSFFRSMLLAI